MKTDICASAPLNRRSENGRVHPVTVAELDLGNRHKGQSLGNKPDRQGLIFYSADSQVIERA
jgi:hypothetical protein